MTSRESWIVGLSALAWIGCSSSGNSGSNGAQGPPGPAGPPGTSVAPSLTGVFPRTFLLDRELDVVILGNATSFMGNEMPDFGPGIGVFSVMLSSPTVLSAHIKVDKAAMLGLRDLHVGSLTATGIVSVAPPMQTSVLTGMVAQGSLAVLDLINLDANNAFDLGFGLTPDPGVGVGVVLRTATEARLITLFDPLAPTSPAQLTGANVSNTLPGGPQVITTYLSAPDAVTPAARAPTALTADTPVNDALANPLDTGFYHFTTDGTTQVVEFALSGTDPTSLFQPLVTVYGSGGLGANRIGSFQPPQYPAVIPVTNVATDLYAIVYDRNFGAGSNFGYAITVSKSSATAVAEQASAHATPMTAQSIAYAGPIVISGNLSAYENDCYAITALPLASTCWDFSFTGQPDDVFVNGDVFGAFANSSYFAPGTSASFCYGESTATSFCIQSNSASSMGSYLIGFKPRM